MKIKFGALTVLLGALAISSNLQAATYSETGTFTDSDASLTLSVSTTSIAGFNTALGTLTGINVAFTSMTTSGSTTLQNTDTNPSTVTEATLRYSGAGRPVLSGPGVSSLTFPLAGAVEVPLSGNSPIAGNSSEFWSGGPVTTDPGLATSQNIASGSFGSYLDTPVVFDIDGTGSSVIAFTGGSPQFVNSSLTGSGLVTVTYTYTPIPEPSAALLGALGVLGLLRRRR